MLEPEKPSRLGSWFVTGVILALLIFTVILVALAFPAGLYAVFHNGLSTQLSAGSLVGTYLWIGPVPTLLPVDVSIGGIFLLLSVIYAVMFLYSLFQQTRPLKAIRDSFGSGVGSLLKSPFIVIIVAIGFLNFSGSVITAASQSVLGSVGNPFANIDLLLEFGSLTFAPLREEFGFRVILIGLIALILSMGRPPKTALKALWRPSVLFEGAAIGGATTVIIWIALLGSAATFGICHVNCGGAGGWSWAKLPDAIWGGVVLGYLYIRYGFHVAVLTHWGVDYFGSVFSFFGQSAFGIPVNSTTVTYVGQNLVDIDMLLLFGLVSFLLVAYLTLKKVVVWRSRTRESLIDKGLDRGPLLDP